MPEPSAGESLASSAGCADLRDPSEHVRPCAMFFAAEIAVAHECQLFSVDRDQPVQHIASSDAAEQDVAHAKRVRTAQHYAVTVAFDERTHAHAAWRENDLLTRLQQPGYLGNQYVVGHLVGHCSTIMVQN